MALKSKSRPKPGRRQSQLDRLGTFDRNRTITGTTSSNLNSANEQNSSLKSDRIKAHDLSRSRRKATRALLVILVSIGFITWAISQFTAVPVVTLDKSFDYSLEVAEPERYESVIEDYLKSNPLARFRVVLDEQNLSNYVSQRLPEVESVGVAGRLKLGETEFVLSMRQPVASWLVGDKKYYVDGGGSAFDVNYFSEPTVQIVDETGVVSQVSDVLASNRMLSFVGRVVELARLQGYQVAKVVLPPETTRQINVELKSYSYYVKLSVDRPAGAQVEDMDNSIRHLKSRGVKPRYIDVRVGGRAFYR